MIKCVFHISLPHFLISSFDWHEKVLEKTIKTDLHMQEYLKSMEKAMESITGKLQLGVAI